MDSNDTSNRPIFKVTRKIDTHNHKEGKRTILDATTAISKMPGIDTSVCANTYAAGPYEPPARSLTNTGLSSKTRR